MIKVFIVFLTSIISTIGVAYLYYKLANVKHKYSIKSLVVFMLGVIFVYMVQLYHIEYLGHISFFIFYPILFYTMKQMSLKKLTYYVIIIWLYGTALDLLAMLVVSVIHHFYSFNVYSIYFECILSFVVFILLVVFANLKGIKIFTNNIYKKIIQISHVDIFIILFSVFVLLMSIFLFLNLHNLKISLLLLFIVLLVIIDAIFLIKYKIYCIENDKFLCTLKENNNFYIKIEDENRIFRHNLTAKLLSIKSVSNKRAMLLIDDLLNNYNKNIDFSHHMKVIPYGLNGILYQKLYPYLKELNIKLYNDIDYDIFDVLKPRRYNVFVEKMVLALDNAIEASLKSKEKILIVNLYDQDDSISIEIKNTFSNTLDIDMLGTKNYSSKGKRRGLGLFSAFRNSEASFKVSVVNDMFVSKIATKKRLVD